MRAIRHSALLILLFAASYCAGGFCLRVVQEGGGIAMWLSTSFVASTAIGFAVATAGPEWKFAVASPLGVVSFFSGQALAEPVYSGREFTLWTEQLFPVLAVISAAMVLALLAFAATRVRTGTGGTRA